MKNITYQISDTSTGMFLNVTLPEGSFNLTLKHYRGMNNRREWKVVGNYPSKKWSISYNGADVSILALGGSYTEGQEIIHKAHGKGVVKVVGESMVTIDFEKVGQKTMLTSILNNFIQ